VNSRDRPLDESGVEVARCASAAARLAIPVPRARLSEASFAGILERDELAPAGQRDRTIEASRSALGRHRANLSAPAAVNFTF
jgi:hypothetical protein